MGKGYKAMCDALAYRATQSVVTLTTSTHTSYPLTLAIHYDDDDGIAVRVVPLIGV